LAELDALVADGGDESLFFETVTPASAASNSIAPPSIFSLPSAPSSLIQTAGAGVQTQDSEEERQLRELASMMG
jgi:hypothetical protein